MGNFDPNGAAAEDSGIFGLPYNKDESELIVLPVPWSATCSYGNSTSDSPLLVFEESKYVELFDKQFGAFYEKGIYFDETEYNRIKEINTVSSKLAHPIIEAGGIIDYNEDLKKDVNLVNEKSTALNKIVYDQTASLLEQQKFVGLLGGDHSISLGCIQAYCEKYPNLGILQIDAHADLRTRFEGFEYSHASIMHNAISSTSLNKLVQVGVRGYCSEEYSKICSNEKIVTFFASDLSEAKYAGQQWDDVCRQICEALPNEVYVSFDIDGLDIPYCFGTGTPMPGGLTYNEAIYLINKIAESKNIIGFDLVEVGLAQDGQLPDPNLIVAANLLYKLCGSVLFSN